MTSLNLSEGDPEYNFHWEHKGGIWAAKGMFGQTCALIPELDGSIDQITKIELRWSDTAVEYVMRDHRGEHRVRAGLDHWIHGETSMTGAYLHHQYEMDTAKVSACAYWKDSHTLMMEWRYPEMAFFDHVSITWSDRTVKIKRWVNMNSQDRERPEITANIK